MDNTKARLIELGKLYLIERNVNDTKFSGNLEADTLLKDLVNYPHFFVLACLMDRQMRSEKPWGIPYTVMKELDCFNVKELAKIEKKQFIGIFKKMKLHRFNEKMGTIFYDAVQKIHKDYKDNASLIWDGKPSSATVVSRFLEFNGAGLKIATMATNILAREFKIPFSDYYSIDISTDIHIRRVLKRIGLVQKDAKNEQIRYIVRSIYPKYPGIFDGVCWDIGRNYCRPNRANCNECCAKDFCKKIIDIEK